jgi:hypothetical protein
MDRDNLDKGVLNFCFARGAPYNHLFTATAFQPSPASMKF